MPKLIEKSSKSWGRLASSFHRSVFPSQLKDIPQVFQHQGSFLPFGLGRSYGDSCLNSSGALIHSRGLDKMIAFDRKTGSLTCESGVSLAEILELAVPNGWFLPVTPGTKFVTVGGAIANDVHGKNHHVRGTFGQHVKEFELIRSNAEVLRCSPTHNVDLYRATIGGLGLTGFISWASIQLIPISSPLIYQEAIKFHSLDEFFAISDESDQNFEYTVAWVDCMARDLGRGIFYRGRHFDESAQNLSKKAFQPLAPLFTIPVDAPGWLMNSLLMKAFNQLYFHKQRSPICKAYLHFDSFFYPLDRISQWNRLYGPKGFFQYQFVLPLDQTEALRSVFATIRRSELGTSLAVFKRFGSQSSPGILSFPRPGYTLALDFANRGRKTQKLFDELDQIILEAGGRIYPAKDACMSARQFQQAFPMISEFQKYIDPRFSSDFWQRVSA